MVRLNLALDSDTFASIDRQAKRSGTRRAAVARSLIREAIEARARRERMRALAADYAADRKDSDSLLAELESGQVDLIADEEE